MMNKESRTDKWLRTGFVLFLVVLVLLIVFNGTAKISDVSNWIIAFANIAMATAAVGAWRAARKFLSEFFAQEGYKLAIELINENVIHLGLFNNYSSVTHKALIYCKGLNSMPHTEDSWEQLQSELVQVQNLHKNHKEWSSNILSLSFRMETYGIYPADRKNAALTEMVSALARLNRQGDGFCADLQNIANRYKKVISSKKNWHLHFSVIELSEMEATLKLINLEWNTMVASRNVLLTGGKHARTLFVVREN